MATQPIPQSIVPKAGTYDEESNTFSSFSDAFRFFQPARIRVSKNSPPVLNVDITEGQLIWDRTLNRLYTVSNGALKYAAFT